jgi:hypothetical protein
MDKLRPFKFILEGKRCVFYITRRYGIRIGHLYDVCNKIECSLYHYRDTDREFFSGVEYFEVPDMENLIQNGELIPYFEEKEFNISTENIDIFKFKGFDILSDYEVSCFIKDKLIDVVGKEHWLHN